MGKFLLIGVAIAILYYLLSARKTTSTKQASSRGSLAKGLQLLTATNTQIATLSKHTVKLVGIGVVLLLISIFIGFKFKVLLFLLPVALYLIAYLFLLSNHIKKCKDQRLYYNPETQELRVESISRQGKLFNLQRDLLRVECIEAIQNPQGVVYGYYRLYFPSEQVIIPYLVAQNLPANQAFFDVVNKHPKLSKERRIFPII